MSVAEGIAQPRNASGCPTVEGDVDERGHQHPARRRHAREKPTSPAGEMTVEYLTFYL